MVVAGNSYGEEGKEAMECEKREILKRGKLDGGGDIFPELKRISRFSVSREVDFRQFAVKQDAP